LIKSWSNDKHGHWKVLALSGWSDFAATDVRFAARSQAVGLSAGLVLRYDRKFSSWPWLLHRLVSEQWSDDEKNAVCLRLKSSKACELPLFAAEFLNAFPEPSQMRSPKALAVLRVWADGKKFTTKASELGHSAERQALSSANAPGKIFLPHARRDFLQKCRLEHIANHGADPAAKIALRGAAAKASLSACMQATEPDLFDSWLPKEVLELVDLPSDGTRALEDIANTSSQRIPAIARALLALPPVARPPPPPLPPQASVAGVAIGSQLSLHNPATRQSGSGGSVYLTHLNRCRSRFKQQIGQRSMTPEESRKVTEQARDEWHAMSIVAKDAMRDLYDAQVHKRQRGDRDVPVGTATVANYRPGFANGSPQLPIKPTLFCQAFLHCKR
jgi:hypothetical protein